MGKAKWVASCSRYRSGTHSYNGAVVVGDGGGTPLWCEGLGTGQGGSDSDWFCCGGRVTGGVLLAKADMACQHDDGNVGDMDWSSALAAPTNWLGE